MSSISFAARAAMGKMPRDLMIFFAVVLVAGIGLYVESFATNLTQQNALSAAAWVVLLALLKGESAHTRIQVAVVIVVAVNAEILFSPQLHFFAYRFNNIPMYVPPGHGLLYLSALALSRSDFFRRYQMPFTWLALTIGTAWAVWNVFFAERGDVGGAVLFAVLFVFILVGRTHPLYVAAFFITAYLEMLGTSFDNWSWASEWPFLGLSQANPPCGISAGYCIFDALGVGGAALIGKIRGKWTGVASEAVVIPREAYEEE